MATKKVSVIKTLINLMAVSGNIFNFLRNILTLAELEARLASRSMMIIIVLLIFLATLVTATWLGVLAILFLYLSTFHVNPIFSLFLILILNFLVIVLVSFILSKESKNLFFPNTRRKLRSLVKMD